MIGGLCASAIICRPADYYDVIRRRPGRDPWPLKHDNYNGISSRVVDIITAGNRTGVLVRDDAEFYSQYYIGIIWYRVYLGTVY